MLCELSGDSGTEGFARCPVDNSCVVLPTIGMSPAQKHRNAFERSILRSKLEEFLHDPTEYVNGINLLLFNKHLLSKGAEGGFELLKFLA